MGAGSFPPAQAADVRPAFRGLVILLAGAALAFLPAGLAAVRAQPVDTLLWIAFISVANLLTVPMLPTMRVEVTLGAPVSVAAAVLLPAPLALLVNGLSLAGQRELRDRTVWPWMAVFNHSQLALSAGAASFAAQPFAAVSEPFSLVLRTVAAVAAYNVVNTAAITAMLWLRGRLSLAAAAKESAAPFPRFALDFGLVALLGLFIVIASKVPAAVLLLALPLWLGYNALQSAREAEDRSAELAVRVRELETLNALASELLSARRDHQVRDIAATALRVALDSDAVELCPAGDIGDDLQVIKIPGAEPAAIGIPVDLTERQLAVAEAVAGLIGMALQRLDLELELGEVQRARAALSGQILEEGTRERSRIALEIHDDVLPYLAAAEIQADNVRSALARADLDRADRLAGATRDAVNGGLARLREVIEALRRQIVVPGGLREGLQDALRELALHHGIDGRLDAPDVLPPLPLAVEITLLETVRGCLANVARHADARRVDIRLRVEGPTISATVRDDGRGFDAHAVPASRQGLALMAQRVELARGTFEVDSAPGRGTRVHVEVPL
ncbi:MAG: histidine kinase [Actinomycetota bacterium]|nr:histidine kinase [Actinomycetota bacterium]